MDRFYRFLEDADSAVRRWLKISARRLNHWYRQVILAVKRFFGMLARTVKRILYREPHHPHPHQPPPARSTVPPRRKIMILMLGLPGSGKTLMLAALYEYFKLGGKPGITLIPDDASERELFEMTRNIRDARNPFLPEGTGAGMTKEWRFGVRVDWENARDHAFELTYLDYAGQHAADLGVPLDANTVPDEQFRQALRDANIVMGVLDGSKILKLMTGDNSGPLVTEIGLILRRLVLAEQKSIHLVISKWDLLIDQRSGYHYTMNQVIGTLEGHYPWIRNFLSSPQFKSMRIIPVAALGTGFVRPDPGDPDGKAMIKNPGAQWNPENIEIPFFCAIPDIIKGDVELLKAGPGGDRGRKVARSGLSEAPSWVTIAAAGLAGVTLVITPHAFTASVAFSQIIGLIRDAVKERPRGGGSKLYGPDAALARVLRVCYEEMDHYERRVF